MRKYFEFRNASTIINTVLLTVFGLIIGYATSKGVNLPFNAEIATSITSGVILFVFGYFNAKHQNTLFDDEKDTIYIPVDNLTDEQITGINNFINKAIEKNIRHANNEYNITDVDLTGIEPEPVEDNDPAGNYEEE